MEPRYLILDEPTAYLDEAARRRFRALIDDLRRQGMAIIHITHELREVAEADRLVVMARGAIAAEGAPRDLLGQPDVREAMSPQRAAEAPCV
jgi:energy-coupling factor transporter ATP-binding protein EcfA2